MRDIRFRAWDKALKQWVNITQMNFNEKGKLLYVYASGNLYGKIDHPLTELEIVRPTGLLDKNGKEIFEGDIVRLHESHFIDGELIVQAVFKNGYFGFTPDETEYEPMFLEASKSEIIGNVWENKDLLK